MVTISSYCPHFSYIAVVLKIHKICAPELLFYKHYVLGSINYIPLPFL